MPPTSHVQNAVLLILDDEPDIANSLAQFLQSALPSAVVVAKNTPAEAKTFLASNRVDALVVDYRMPEQNGIDFLEEMRKARPDVPSILITGHGHPEVLANAINRAGVQGIFLKPFDEAALVAAVDRLLRKRMGSAGRIPFQPVFGRKESP